MEANKHVKAVPEQLIWFGLKKEKVENRILSISSTDERSVPVEVGFNLNFLLHSVSARKFAYPIFRRRVKSQLNKKKRKK